MENKNNKDITIEWNVNMVDWSKESFYMTGPARENVQDEPTAESRSAPAAEAGREPRAGGGSAPSLCSASEASDKEAA